MADYFYNTGRLLPKQTNSLPLGGPRRKSDERDAQPRFSRIFVARLSEQLAKARVGSPQLGIGNIDNLIRRLGLAHSATNADALLAAHDPAKTNSEVAVELIFLSRRIFALYSL